MSQSKKGSALEAVTSTAIGYVVAIGAQMVILPLFGLTPSFSDNVGIAAMFTAVSLVRGYVVRRSFVFLGASQKETVLAARRTCSQCKSSYVRQEGDHPTGTR